MSQSPDPQILPDGRERREWERYRSLESRPCLVLAGPDGRCRRGTLRDVSAQGFGLALREPLGVGEEVVVDLSEQWGWPVLLFSGRVAHATALPTGGWLIGCSLTRVMGKDEIVAVLGGGEARVAAASP
jgi:hypothetical protein